eukprot:m.30478 g.30478  ORF g.30478 m.30478 type:complete len:274 (+) comp16292_c0_seq2:241-1062(+)
MTDFVSIDFDVPHSKGGEISCNLLRRRRRLNDHVQSNNNTVAIVCHPYSYLGGDMHNYVVCLIQQCIAEYMPCIRFDFRRGSLFGSQEVEDAKSLITHLLIKTNKDGEWTGYDKVLVAGYSAGSHVAIHAAQHLFHVGGGVTTAAVGENPLAGLLAVSGAFGRLGSWGLGWMAKSPNDIADTIPCLFVNGEDDQYCGATQFLDFVEKFFNTRKNIVNKQALERNENLVVEYSSMQKAVLIPDAHHFWTPHEFSCLENLFSQFVNENVLIQRTN